MRAELSFKTKVFNSLRQVLTVPVFEPALVRFSQGRKLGSLPTRLLPNHYQYPKPSWRSVSRKGLRYELDLADIVDWAIFFDLAEPDSNRLFSLARPGDVVVDVGANIGHVSLTLAERCGSQGRVYSFEPDPNNFERLKKNLGLNRKITTVTAENLGLGSQPDRLTLYRVDPRNPGMNRILPAEQGTGERTQIHVVTLDSYVAEKQLKRLDLIKIDVEGFELNVLQGAAQSIERWKPKMYVEVSEANLKVHGHSARQLLNWLHERGYRFENALTGNKIELGRVGASFLHDVVCLSD